MFNFKDLKDIHFEITNRCQASCPMCSRNYHGGLENPLIKNQDWSTEDFKKIATKELLEQINGFYMCGNFGDPIINVDLIEMIEYAAQTNPDLYIRIHTNGSARTIEWWERLAKALPKKHNVIFALDGLEDTHYLYRKGTNFVQIIKNAQAFINAGGHAEWCFIKFKHNEHQVDDAKAYAKNIGFALFTEKNSSRFIGSSQFPVYDSKGVTEYFLEPPSSSELLYISKKMIKNYKQALNNVSIDCYVKHTKEIYIDAYKNVFPCCFLASAPFNYAPKNDITNKVRSEMLKQYYDLKNTLGNTNALQSSVKDIVSTETWQTVWNKYWTENKLITCARTCGKLPTISKPKDQIINTIGLS
jgi:MoaA/NifB/PqqE/SkfB family radical SAM enzyme